MPEPCLSCSGWLDCLQYQPTPKIVNRQYRLHYPIKVEHGVHKTIACHFLNRTPRWPCPALYEVRLELLLPVPPATSTLAQQAQPILAFLQFITLLTPSVTLPRTLTGRICIHKMPLLKKCDPGVLSMILVIQFSS